MKDLVLFGKKVGMTTVFDDEGNVVPVTAVELGENVITAIKSIEKDGYSAVQVGAFETKEKHCTKATAGHLQKNNLPLFKKRSKNGSQTLMLIFHILIFGLVL